MSHSPRKPTRAADTAPKPVPFCSIKHSSSDLNTKFGFWTQDFSKVRKTYLSSWSLFLFAKIPVYPLPDESLEFDLK